MTAPGGTRRAEPPDRERVRAAYRRQVALVAGVAAVSAGAALLADGAPTGTTVVDAIWRAAFAGVVTLAAAWSDRWTWVVLAGAAAAAAVGGDPVVVALGGLALVGAVVAFAVRRRQPVAGAVVAGVSVQVLLRLPDVGPVGLTALVAAAAVVPVLVSGWRRSGRRARRRLRPLVGAVALFVLVGLAGAAVAAVITWQESGTAVGESNAWIDAARDGDQEAMLGHLDAAGAAFGTIDETIAAWWLAPARALPLLGPQLDAIGTVARGGDGITRAATEAARITTVEDLRLRDGGIDVALLQTLRDPLRATATEVDVAKEALAALDRTWLVPLVRDRVEAFGAEVDEAEGDVALAADALEVAPALLGAEGDRTYLVLFASPAETRELGGFVGNMGVLTASAGSLELTELLRAGELNERTGDLTLRDLPPGTIDAFPRRYLRYGPWRFWQNITGTPDFPTVADMVRTLTPPALPDPVDGVVLIDPEGLAGLLELTGPIEVEGLDEPLTSDTVADFLLRGQYVRFPDRAERTDFLEDVADATFDRLTSGELPGPRAIGDALGPAARAGHLRLWTFDDAEQTFLTRLGVDGALAVPEGSDAFLATVANANPNKIDAYLRREITYEATVDPGTGEVRAAATVTLRNDATLDLPPYVIGNGNDDPEGTNRTFLSVYSALAVEGATVDGAPLDLELLDEYGLSRASAFVTVPPGGAVTVRYTLAGTVAPGRPYRLEVLTPALVSPDVYTVRIGGADGAPADAILVEGAEAVVVDGEATFTLLGGARVTADPP